MDYAGLQDAVLGGVLGNGTFRVKFINSAPGAPLPDLVEIFVCHFQDLQVLSFVGQASGLLPDGSAGRLEVTQTCLLTIAAVANEKSRFALDACPAEHIVIRPPGK